MLICKFIGGIFSFAGENKISSFLFRNAESICHCLPDACKRGFR